MTLEGLRRDIDGIDTRILALLGDRLEKALLTRRFKTGSLDSTREADLLDSVRSRSQLLLRQEFTSVIYRLIMDESKAIQDKGLILIGFKGSHGTDSDIAARTWSPDAASIAFLETSQLTEAILEGNIDYGVLPEYSSMGGTAGLGKSVQDTTQLSIVSELTIPVHHCLMAAPGTDNQEIRKVYSSEEALAQCMLFLERNRLDSLPWYDSAGAARMIAETRPAATAAIASRLAAEVYGLHIIKDGIQDARLKQRFLVLAKA